MLENEGGIVNKTNKNGLFMKLVVAVIILQVIVYTWVHLYLSYKVGVEITPTSTIGFYGFCGFEVGICGWLKKHKNIEQNFRESDQDERDFS